MSQLDRVVKELEKGPITQAEALKRIGVAILGARILDLRERGYLIHSRMIEVKNRFGDTCRVAEYSLIQKPAHGVCENKTLGVESKTQKKKPY